jgi:hypothetical protein
MIYQKNIKENLLKDIVLMHQEAEKLIGRQGSEVGDSEKW